MKQISILRARLTNFMGVKSFETTFENGTTEFHGDNGTGKTTLATSFFWTLWGKDMCNRADTKFCVKPLDVYNQTDRNTITEVEWTLDVDGQTITLKRTYKENWGTKRGETTEKYLGNETCRYWNDVLKKEGEYNALVSSEICEESLFRLVTDPIYFFSQKPADQRKFLMNLAGEVTPEQIVSAHPEFAPVVAELSPTKTLAEYKEQVQQTIKRLKADADTIPARIDERKRDMPEAKDWNALEAELKHLQDDEQVCELNIQDRLNVNKQLQEERKEVMEKILHLQKQVDKERMELNAEARSMYETEMKTYKARLQEHASVTGKISSLESSIKGAELRLADMQSRREKLLEEYNAIKARTLQFDDVQFICPTCKRPLDAEDVETKKQDMLLSFNTQKTADADRNIKEGVALRSQIDTLEARKNAEQEELLKYKQRELELAEQDSAPVLQTLEDTQTIKSHLGWIEELQKHLDDDLKLVTDECIEQWQKAKQTIRQGQNSVQARLMKRTQIENNQKRIAELEEQYRHIQAEVARQTGTLELIKAYSKTYMGQVEASVNLMFDIIEFKLFEKQINEGERECCEALVDGVPYSTNVNTASRINAGLDFVLAVQKKYELSAPVFVDNKESVTHLFETDHCQIVTLVKDENYQVLTKY